MAMFDKHKGGRQTPPGNPEAKAGTPAAAAVSTPATTPSRVAMIGQGISITGDVNANSDLKIEGTIEGRSIQSAHDVEIGEHGKVTASIIAKVVKIAGEVTGDVSGSEKVLIARSGKVQGNIDAPRVQLEDGALFRGSIDMNPVEPVTAKQAAPEKADNKVAAAPAVSHRKEPSLTLKSG
jgi:cytoskeletal protein CcmA (bactofilin family)